MVSQMFLNVEGKMEILNLVLEFRLKQQVRRLDHWHLMRDLLRHLGLYLRQHQVYYLVQVF